MLKNLYAARVPAKAANVPMTAWVTMPSPKRTSKNLLSAPSATPSAAQKASTRAGLITRLNELASDSPKAIALPRSSAVLSFAMFASLAVSRAMTSPMKIHVAAAKAITTNSARPVFWTTESIVIRSADRSWVGVPVPQVEGSPAGWP